MNRVVPARPGISVRVRRMVQLVVVVGLVSGLVSVAQAAPQPGASCKVAGRERVTSAGTLRCTLRRGRKLRWVQVATPTTTTTTTTTTTVASPRAPQVSRISADNSRIRFTLSGMSPDTQNYAVQWVQRGQSFNTYNMRQVTERDVAFPVGDFACGGHTYTFRVFVMRADWVLSQGHQTQNVTPHSELFDVTTDACPVATTVASTGGGTTTTTTTTIAVTCAAGGTCVVGDTGPGGGIVFYVAGSNFTSTGSDCNTTCRYLEAAPAPGGGDVSRSWATNANSNQSTAVPAPGATATGIGSGMANTNAIQAQTGNVADTSAAVYAYDYSNAGKSDWHLPSKDELNQLYINKATVGGFALDFYWSSSESSAAGAWNQFFGLGDQSSSAKTNDTRVRPVRAF